MKTSKAVRLTLLFSLSLCALLLLLYTSGGRLARASNTRSLRPAVQSTDPAVVGRWELQANGTTVDTSWNSSPLPIHINLLPNGKLLFWGRDKRTVGAEVYDDQGFTTASIWDPFYKSFTSVDLVGPTPDTKRTKTNLFCSGHSFLPDGRLLVTGGHNIYEPVPLAEGMGSIHTNIFDYRTNTWTSGPDMNNGRWYPYNLTLGNGETLVVAGAYLKEIINGQPRVALNDVAQIYDVQGNLRNVSKLQDSGLSTTPINNYPLLHLLADGRALVAASGSDKRSFVLSPSPFSGQGTWTQEGQLALPHDRTTAALYQKDKVLVPGGSNGRFIQSQAEVYERDATGFASWRSINPMAFQRIYHTATVLPDGNVLVTGGTTCEGSNGIDCTTGAAKTPELWNPATETWTQMANHQETRVYHSTAILLPDARVLVGGGGRPAAQGEIVNGTPCLSATSTTPSSPQCREYGHNNVEIFSPPYLFLPNNGGPAPRPTITAVPKEMTYGQNFTVGVGTVTAQEIESAVLVRLGAVTHGFNQDQRRVALAITSRAGDGRSLNLTAPASGNDCPPGYYMLFLMKRYGVNLTPSVAKIVRVNKASTPPVVQAIQGKGESRSLPVTVTPGTNWTATVTGGGGFISIQSPVGTATGTGTLNYTVAVNTTGSPRSGTITISVPNQPVFNQVISIYQGKQFDDVPSAGVEDTPSKLSALGITSGCTATGFCPNDAITRDQISIFFVRAALDVGVSPPTPTTVTFPNDVPSNYWAYSYIEDFYKRGFTSGCGVGSFCPGGNVSRNELAVFLVKALGIDPPATQQQTFQDVAPSSPYHRFIEEAYARGFMTACGSAPSQPQSGDTVWVEDNVPAGAIATGDSEGWNWVGANPTPFSSMLAHQSNIVAGPHQHYFYGATGTNALTVNSGDKLYAYVYLDPLSPPTELMLQWNDGTWEHRAYWGANQIGYGTDGTNSRRYMGSLPPLGQWVRLEVAASDVGLEGRTLNGMAFTLFGGRATWDRAGKSSETVWVEDSIPAGAIATGEAEGWNWVGANPSPFSGTLAHQSNLVAGQHQHYFYGATGSNALTVNTGDKLFTYVYLDPLNPPSEVMLQWNDGTWEHRAYWGSNQINFGVNGTTSRRYMGPLPSGGQWVRLEVPASDVGLEGHTLQGMAFTLFGGRATWDRAGKTSTTTPTGSNLTFCPTNLVTRREVATGIVRAYGY